MRIFLRVAFPSHVYGYNSYGRSTGGASGHHECISTPRTPACSRHPQRLDHGEDILVPWRRDLAVDAGAAVRAAGAGPVGGGGGDDVARLLRLRVEHLRSHVTLKLLVTRRQPCSVNPTRPQQVKCDSRTWAALAWRGRRVSRRRTSHCSHRARWCSCSCAPCFVRSQQRHVMSR